MRPMLMVLLLALTLAADGCTGADTASTIGVGTTSATTVTTAVTTRPPTTSSSTLPVLSDAYPGGFGFFLGSADQTVGLFVYLADWRDFSEGRLPETSVLPNGLWEAELRIGNNLFVSWGKDYHVPESWVVDAVWPVVAGTITLLELPPQGDCGKASARLGGFEAVSPDGTRIHVGDLEVENARFGCLLG